MTGQPPPLDDLSTFYNDASYGMYDDMVYKLFPDLPDVEAESSDALVPVVRSPSPKEKHDSPSRTAHGDLLSKAVEALRCQVTNTTNQLHAEHGPDSSRAFLSTLSALCTLPTEHFARLCTGIHRASTSFYPDTPPASDAGSPSIDSSKGKTGKPVQGIQSREAKLEKFITSAIEALTRFVNNHWERLAVGLKVQELQGDPFSNDKRLRRLYHHFELRKLRQETELHWLRRALSLIRNLHDFQEYLEENGHGLSDTPNYQLRHAYLVYIYAAGFSSSVLNMSDIKTALKEDLRYAARWMIFVNALGLGAVLVCGEVIAKLVYKTSGNNNDVLDWLATQIGQCCTIDFRALCSIFDTAMADLLQHYQVKDPLNKFELIAKIQTIASGSATGGLLHYSD